MPVKFESKHSPDRRARLFTRSGEIARLMGRLNRDGYPRLPCFPRPALARHWLESALRRTALPFALTALGLALIGYALHAYAPEAYPLGEVLWHFRMPVS